jgi:hypothetical protein
MADATPGRAGQITSRMKVQGLASTENVSTASTPHRLGALAGAAFSAALLVGCGAKAPEQPAQDAHELHGVSDECALALPSCFEP